MTTCTEVMKKFLKLFKIIKSLSIHIIDIRHVNFIFNRPIQIKCTLEENLQLSRVSKSFDDLERHYVDDYNPHRGLDNVLRELCE